MALPPETQNEAFLREVEESYRRDQLESFAKTYGKWIIAGLVLFLAAVAGWIYWQEQQKQKAAEQTEELNRAFTDLAAGRTQAVPARLEPLEDSRSDAVRASALLTGAAVALESNDRKTAVAKYRELAGDEGMADIYRNIATIRMTAIEFDALKPEQIIERLESLAKPGSPWFGSAGEMIAMAYLRQGQNEKAGRLFAAIAADRQVPDSIRSRAVQIAGTLGVDATESLPALQQQD